MGIGSASDVTLAEAREEATQCRKFIRDNKDPIELRKRASMPSIRTAKSVPTFGEFADEWWESVKSGFDNASHRDNWERALRAHAAPIRKKAINAISTDDMVKLLLPMWSKRHETASRLRGRIERVLDAAKAKKLRSGDNPAAWRGHLKLLLPARRRLTRGHHPALPWERIPSFFSDLREKRGTRALCLEFTILTSTRTEEATRATLSEIDRTKMVWTIPQERMKMRREHRVPLTPEILAVIDSVHRGRSRYLFPGLTSDTYLSSGGMLSLVKSMDPSLTVHGFRSTFRDWVGEATAFPGDLAEHALAHRVGNEVQMAYRRGDALDRRRELMEAWTRYCYSNCPRQDDVDHGEKVSA